MRFCTYCGSQVDDSADFCSNCGKATIHKGPKKKVRKTKDRAKKPINKLKLIIIIASVVILLGAIYLALSIIKSQNTQNILDALEGKIFLVDADSDVFHSYYSFKDGKISYERWTSDGVYGDINTYYQIENDSSIFEDSYRFDAGALYITLYLDDDGYICYSLEDGENWQPTTSEEMENMRKIWQERWWNSTCDHVFDAPTTLTAATCEKPGTERQVCKLCGYNKITEIPESHNVINGVCSSCGKVAIQANKWNTLDSGLISYQNCLIYSVQNKENMVYVVHYYMVCENCHKLNSNIGVAALAIAPELRETFYGEHWCFECQKDTIVMLMLE